MDDWHKTFDNRLERIERLLEVVVRIEERQTTQFKRLEALEELVGIHATKMVALESKVDKWVQRGIGLWTGVAGLVVLGWTVFTYIKPGG